MYKILSILICLAGTQIAIADELHLFADELGMHFGTEQNPQKCCYCDPVVSANGNTYTTAEGRQIKVHPSNEHVSRDTDGKLWVCPAIGTPGYGGIPACLVGPPGSV